VSRPTAYALLACGRKRGLSVARFVNATAGVWELTSATRHDTAAAPPPGSIASIEGDFQIGADYAGCPRCGADGYVKCGQCEQLSCWKLGTAYTCGWCGARGEVSPGIKSVRRVD
jgi:hypothetical protein